MGFGGVGGIRTNLAWFYFLSALNVIDSETETAWSRVDIPAQSL